MYKKFLYPVLTGKKVVAAQLPFLSISQTQAFDHHMMVLKSAPFEIQTCWCCMMICKSMVHPSLHAVGIRDPIVLTFSK